jgi:hypothetical protein
MSLLGPERGPFLLGRKSQERGLFRRTQGSFDSLKVFSERFYGAQDDMGGGEAEISTRSHQSRKL